MYQQVTLRGFVRRRLGSDDYDLALVRRMFARALGAGSFGEFWQYWNPVCGYLLSRFCYRPLCNLLPRPLAFVMTFACSGFLFHDLPFWWGITALWTRTIPPPVATLWFTIMALFVLAGEKLRLDFSALPFLARAAINCLQVAAGAVVALAVVLLAR
jgi:hypothetical protein